MRAGVPTNSKTRPGDQRELGGGATDPTSSGMDQDRLRIDPASSGVQHVIGDLVVRQACGGFQVATLQQFVRGERRHGNVFGIAPGAHRQVASADEHRLADRAIGDVAPARYDRAAELDPGIAGSGGIQA